MADTPVLLYAFLGILQGVHRSTDFLAGFNLVYVEVLRTISLIRYRGLKVFGLY